MRDAIQTSQRGQIVGWGVVYESAILRSHEDVVRKVDVGAGAINEPCAGLHAGAREVFWVEDQCADAGQSERSDSAERQAEDIGARDLV